MAGPRWARRLVAAYVELIRNTPFIVQLFFVFFGLPSLGIHIDEVQAAILAMTVNLGAYAIEIVRAGIDSIPRGQVQAAQALGLHGRQVFRYVVLPQALANVFPALLSQVLIVMLGSAVVSQISVPDLTYAANFIQSRNFRSFESYLIITATYLLLSIVLRQLLNRLGRGLFAGRTPRTARRARATGGRGWSWRGARTLPTERLIMIEFTLWDIARNLLLAARWTVLLSLIAFVVRRCGRACCCSRCACRRCRGCAGWSSVYVELFQGTPLLMQLFLAFFGLPLLGVDVSPWVAATVTLTLYTSAYLVDIWRGCVEAVPRGQWAAGASLGMTFGQQLRYIVWPQAKKIAVAPTVGFLVQVVKSTALTSIIGFTELTKTGTMITNAAFRPFPIYGMVAMIYFAMCFPLTWYARRLQQMQLAQGRR